MYHVKNMTNSPHKIRLADGTDGRIPARGDGEFDIHPDYVKPLIMSGYLRVTEIGHGVETDDDQTPAQNIIDGMEEALAVVRGETEPHAVHVHESDDIETLRAEYLELTGKPADKRWKEARVRAEIDKALVE